MYVTIPLKRKSSFEAIELRQRVIIDGHVYLMSYIFINEALKWLRELVRKKLFSPIRRLFFSFFFAISHYGNTNLVAQLNMATSCALIIAFQQYT